MSKFNKVIGKKTSELLEYTQNPTIKQAIDDIQQALKSNARVNSNTNTKTLADELFNTAGETDDPLKSAFDKIHKNSDNPDLTAKELTAYLDMAAKLNPNQEENKEPSTENSTSNTANTSTKSVTTSQQPNATQYNPLA